MMPTCIISLQRATNWGDGGEVMTFENPERGGPMDSVTLQEMAREMGSGQEGLAEAIRVTCVCDAASAELPADNVRDIVCRGVEAAMAVVAASNGGQGSDNLLGEISIAIFVVGARLHVIIEDTAIRHGAGPGLWAKTIEHTTGPQTRALGGSVWLAAVPYGPGGVVKYELPLNRVAA